MVVSGTDRIHVPLSLIKCWFLKDLTEMLLVIQPRLYIGRGMHESTLSLFK